MANAAAILEQRTLVELKTLDGSTAGAELQYVAEVVRWIQ
jgi:hypothetical protein